MSESDVTSEKGQEQGAQKAKRNDSDGPIDFFEPDEFARLVAPLNTRYATPLRDLCMLDLMHKSGLRCSEVTGIRPRDVKWKLAQLLLPVTKGGEWRVVPLLDSTMALLARWNEVRRINPKLGGEWFFCTHKKGRVSTSHLRRRIRELAAEAKLEGTDRAHPHALRHSCATTALANGMDIREVQALLGHKRLATTLIYLKAQPKGLVEKYRRLMEGAGGAAADG